MIWGVRVGVLVGCLGDQLVMFWMCASLFLCEKKLKKLLFLYTAVYQMDTKWIPSGSKRGWGVELKGIRMDKKMGCVGAVGSCSVC